MTAPRTAPAQPHGLPGHLVDFIGALRRYGIPVGPSQTVDAGVVLEALGLGDRQVLREGLGCAVLRRAEHRDTYNTVFDLWWPAAIGDRVAGGDGPPDGTDAADPAVLEVLRARLVDLLAADDGAPDRERGLAEVIAEIVERHGRYLSRRGTSYSAYQTLKAMALDELAGRLLAGLLAPYGDEPSPTQRQIADAIAGRRIARARGMVEAETRRRTAEQLGRDHVAAYGVPPLAENVEFLRASAEQLQQLQQTVAPLARTLATRLAARRRRSRAGAIDLRATLRASMSTGGVPIEVVRHRPRRTRPELVVLCDVSGSVAGFSHFTLLLVHALRQQFARVRVFAFVDTTDEVTDLFGPQADLAAAVARITGEAQIHTLDGRSDYGHAFSSFVDRFGAALSPRSSLLVLGDARTNYRDPRRDVLADMVAASRHAHWLNPEPRHLWGSGDSVVDRYRDVIATHECRSAAQLAEVIDTLLPA